MAEHVAPSLDARAFNCPFCNAYAKQDWFDLELRQGETFTRATRHGTVDRLKAGRCAHCSRLSVWNGQQMIFPISGIGPAAADDMPVEIRADYDEANWISELSPRGAAALLRLAIQKLCKHLGQPGKNINEDIAALVKAGLPARVQRALDSVRVIGNESVHPGTLDLKDDVETVAQLFKLVNFIVHKMITEPKEIDSIYSGLPAAKLAEIKRRDGK